MIAANPFGPRPKLDDPWRRLPWLSPSALLVWGALLIGFTLLLRETGPIPEPMTRLDARLIDLPSSAPPGGLQGGAEVAPPPAAAPPAPEPQGHIETNQAQVPPARVKKRKPASPTMYDPRGAHTAPAEAEATTAAQSPAAGELGASGAGASGRVGAGGLGSDSSGARAIYAPVPKIPDDLRENVFETVAVAHFHVTFDGNAKVSLLQPTSNLRLNSMLLDALQQWRFFPAVRNGIAIDSDFDIRIPIAVQER